MSYLSKNILKKNNMQITLNTNQNSKYEDRSNLSASIGFVVHYPFHYFVYKNIYKHIEEISEFIVDMGAFSVEQPPELLSEIILLLEKERVFYRVLNFSDYYYKIYLSSFFKKYNLLVSVWESGCVTIQETKELKKVHVTYGAGKELTFLRPSQSIYDITLDFGERSANLHSYFSYPVITGNAKFDDWFNNTLDEKELSLIEDKLDKNKKTILYLPTHGDLSSVDKITDELIKISPNYNVVIKLHYYISREEPDRFKKLTHKNFLTYNDDCDLLLLLKKADVVLSDNSSAIFDAILADKPIIVTDYLSNDFLDGKHLEKKFYRRGSIGALTYSNSIEQKIKKDGSILTIKKKGELANKIADALNDHINLKEGRKKVRNEIFDYNDGKCGQRGADAILNLLKTSEKKPKKIMHYAMEAYKTSIDALSYYKKDWIEKKIIFYENIIKNKAESGHYFFSIIVIKEDDDDMSFLEMLTRQNFPNNKFEIIVICKNKKIDDVPDKIKIIDNNHFSLGEKIMSAIKISHGNVICFTTSKVLVEESWLTMLYTAYSNNVTISGCGSYRFLERNLYYNYFYIQEIALNTGLGLIKDIWGIYNLYPITNNSFATNPVGGFFNSSYKKKYISKLYIKNNSTPEIEAIIKIEALKHGPLSFIISPSTVRTPITFSQFLYENIMFGFSKYIISKKNNINHGSTSIIETIAHILIQLSKSFAVQNILISLVIFVGYFSRYIGSIFAIVYKNILLLKIKLEDLQNSS